MSDDEAITWTQELLDSLSPSDWQFYGYPLEPIYTDSGEVEGCYRTPPAQGT